MKKSISLFAMIMTLLLSSCVSTYYQVYKADSIDKMTPKDNSLIFEDENCTVFYNLWSADGNIGFRFFNKSNKSIYLNLEESFFIINGMANNYFQNRTFTKSSNIGTSSSQSLGASKSISGLNYLDLLQTNRIYAANSVGIISTSGYSISYNEEKVVCIPSKTSKIITEYSINETRFRNCDLFGYPKKKQIKTVNFTKENSPLVFSNRLVYYIDLKDKPIQFDNSFYVTEITNYPENEMYENIREEFCGQKGTNLVRYFKDASPDKFYIIYHQGTDWKH
jgi:hypothetical protein